MKPNYKTRMQAKHPPIGKRLIREVNTRDVSRAVQKIQGIERRKIDRIESVIAICITAVLFLVMILITILLGGVP